jgi:manganese transport protein
VFLLFAVNRSDLMGEHRNGTITNILGGIVVLIAAGIGLRLILMALGVLG